MLLNSVSANIFVARWC